MPDKAYHNEAWLREQYVDKRRTTTDMAEECDVTPTAISDWLARHGIETRNQQDAQKPDKPYADADWLREEYVEKRRSMKDIGEECDVSPPVILKWLRRYDIETRGTHEERRRGPVSYYPADGEVGDLPGPYMLVASSLTTDDGEREHFRAYVHQLLAIAEGAEPHDVFSDGEYNVHHDNGIRWDNRPENIEFLTGADHSRQHFEERGGLQPWQGDAP